MEDTNTFNEYRHTTLPYQRGGNDVMQSTQMGGQQSFPRQQVSPTRKQPAPAKMPKAKALALLRKLKQGIVVASFLSFGTFSALAVSHTVGATTTSTSTSTSTTASTTKTATATPTTTTTATATPTTTSTQQGGSYGFGSSSSSSNPVSGTHTS